MQHPRSLLKFLSGDPSHSLLARFSLNVGWNLVAAASGFLTVVLVGRIHGTGALGNFALAQSLLVYGEVFTHWGFGAYAITRVAARPRMLRSMVRSLIRLRIPMAILAYGLLCAVTGFIPALRDAFGLTAIMGGVVFIRALCPSWSAQALHQTGVFVAINYSAACLTLPLMGVAWLVSRDLRGVAVAIVVANLIPLLGTWIWLTRRSRTHDYTSESAPAPKVLIRESSPIGFTRLFRGLSYGMDLTLVGIFLSAEHTGHYTAAYKLFLFLQSLLNAYFVILFPRLATSAARSREDLVAEFRASLARSLPWAVAACLAVSLMAAPFLRIVFGPEFLPAAPVLRLMQVIVIMMVLHAHFHQMLLVLGRQKLDMKLTIVSGVFHIGLKALLIPRFGIVGAALGGMLAELGLVLAYACFIRKILADSPESTLLPEPSPSSNLP